MAHPNVVINGVTYSTVPEVQIPLSGGGYAHFYDASDTDATASDVLSGKKFVGSSGESTGTLSVPTVSQNSSTKVLTIS